MIYQPKHTPGPWSLKVARTSCGICHQIGPFPPKPGTERDGYACLYVDYPGNGPHEEEMAANAQLIAAAPDLVAALRVLLVAIAVSDYLPPDSILLAAMDALEKAGVPL